MCPTSPKDRVLLVEGPEDREVIYQFCNYYGIDNRSLFAVEPKQGFNNLLTDLRVRIRTGVKVLGVVIDADLDLNARWEQIGSAIASHSYDFPSCPAPGGTLLEAPSTIRPKIGIWLMPDNQVSGILEDFLLRLANEDDRLIARAENTVDAIPETERLFGETKQSKAIIHTWLAWQAEPGTPLGLAIARRYLDPTRNPAPEFKVWLESLFMST